MAGRVAGLVVGFERDRKPDPRPNVVVSRSLLPGGLNADILKTLLRDGTIQLETAGWLLRIDWRLERIAHVVIRLHLVNDQQSSVIPVDIYPDRVANGTACHRSDRAGIKTLCDCNRPLLSLSLRPVRAHQEHANTDPHSGNEESLHQ